MFLIPTAIKLKCPPPFPCVGGGLMFLERARAEGGPLYTILHYTFLNTEKCDVYSLSDIEARGTEFTRPNENKFKGF
jgi:hypothetical protein